MPGSFVHTLQDIVHDAFIVYCFSWVYISYQIQVSKTRGVETTLVHLEIWITRQQKI